MPAAAVARAQLNAQDELAVLPARARELVRLRMAFHNQCRSRTAVRYDDAVEDGFTEVG